MGGAGVTVKCAVCIQKGEVAQHCVTPKQEVRIPLPFLCWKFFCPTKRNYILKGFLGVLLIRKESDFPNNYC